MKRHIIWRSKEGALWCQEEVMVDKTLIAGCFVWAVFFLILYCLRPKSMLHGMTLEVPGHMGRRLTAAVLLMMVLICLLPMGLSPSYNGEDPAYMNQYELLAESFLEGHLYIDYDDIDPRLLAMDNPYDYEMREAQDISYHWDHAFYGGHYYMYFGVVPVFLVFLPYRLVTGGSLTTYHATQIFVALYICGIFAVFYALAKRFFEKISVGLYLLLSAAFSAISVWYSVDAPALYCTAISAGICMEVWSLFFFMKAVYGGESEWRSIGYAFAGSLFGALAFGCRPPIALANLLVVPLLAEYLKGRKITLKLLGQLVVAATPYIVVGVFLMLYNYMRFDNPFEFGQSYQLTITDQSSYGSFWAQFDPVRMVKGFFAFYLSWKPLGDAFPFVGFNGVLVNFPILCFSVFGMAEKAVRTDMRQKHIRSLVDVMFCVPLIITFADILWAPTVLERYRMDVYWIIGILCYIVIGFYYVDMAERLKRRFSCLMSIWAFATVCMCFLLYLVPYDYNYTFHYIEKLEKIRQVLMLRRGVGLY